MGGLSSRGLDQKIGCIGSLTANLNTGTPEFESAWRSRTSRLNTPEFTDEFNEMIGTLRQGILKSPAELRACCAAYPDSILKDSPSADTRHGFRIDTGRYSYMLVCSFRSADCRLWLNAFSFLALDRHMREARSGIPILDQQGHERFRMPDGGKLRVTSQDGFSPSDISIRNGRCCSMNFMKASFSQSGSFRIGKQQTNFACCPWTLLCNPAVSHTVRDKKDNDQIFLKLEDS
jgi:hypothetical protein